MKLQKPKSKYNYFKDIITSLFARLKGIGINNARYYSDISEMLLQIILNDSRNGCLVSQCMT